MYIKKCTADGKRHVVVVDVYVDDLLLSGPTDNHDAIWQRLRRGKTPIHMEEPEPLDRFLGRTHLNVGA